MNKQTTVLEKEKGIHKKHSHTHGHCDCALCSGDKHADCDCAVGGSEDVATKSGGNEKQDSGGGEQSKSDDDGDAHRRKNKRHKGHQHSGCSDNDSCGRDDKKENERHKSHQHSGCADCGGGVGGGLGGKAAQIVGLSVSLAALIASFVLSELSVFAPGSLFKWFDLGWIAVLICGLPIVRQAVKALVGKKITSNLLIGISMLACIVLEFLTLSGVLPGDGHGHSNIFAAGEVAFLMALGELIEDITVGVSRSGIERLTRLAPPSAKYRVGDTLIEKPLSQVLLGDEVTVLAGDLVSVDGEIVSGNTTVDESIMTGESVPVDKKTGDRVFGGTHNLTGAVLVRVTRVADEMAVNKLKKLVEEAEGKRAPVSKTADRLAAFLVPSAVVLSVAVFLLSYFWLSGGQLATSVLRGVTVLVVFCPCALALATPTAVAAGLGASAAGGILIKSGAAIESIARAKMFAFDKTGTLTEGRLSVDGLFAADGDTSRLMAFTGACERLSDHPIAKALVAYCCERVELPDATNVQNRAGSGVFATVDGQTVTVIRWSALTETGVDSSAYSAAAERFLAQGKTVVATLAADRILGIFALSDTIRAGSAACIASLQAAGVRTVLLTGDNQSAAAAVANQLNMEYRAALLPEQKLAAVESLKSDGGVCMVGDGVNDAPALAAADCSIAMAALGSDAAVETADAALMGGQIERVAALKRFSKTVMTTVKINMILSLLIGFAAVLFSAMGWLTPVTGALVHNLATVLVVLHSASLLLRGFGGIRRKKIEKLPVKTRQAH